MEKRRFGSTKREVAVIGQGTWYIENGDGGAAAAIAALRRGLELGMNHIDTAEMYGSGAAEEVVGQAIFGRRNEVFLVSTVLPQNASRSGTIAACDRSRLPENRPAGLLPPCTGVAGIPWDDTIAAFEQLKSTGKILSWAVSNFDVPDLEDVRKIAGEGNLVCNQVLYQLEERAIEHAVAPQCEKHGVAVVAYSPFGHGHFLSPRTSGGRVLKQIAASHHATVRQVALRFLVRLPPLFVIPKASCPSTPLKTQGPRSSA